MKNKYIALISICLVFLIISTVIIAFSYDNKTENPQISKELSGELKQDEISNSEISNAETSQVSQDLIKTETSQEQKPVEIEPNKKSEEPVTKNEAKTLSKNQINKIKQKYLAKYSNDINDLDNVYFGDYYILENCTVMFIKYRFSTSPMFNTFEVKGYTWYFTTTLSPVFYDGKNFYNKYQLETVYEKNLISDDEAKYLSEIFIRPTTFDNYKFMETKILSQEELLKIKTDYFNIKIEMSPSILEYAYADHPSYVNINDYYCYGDFTALMIDFQDVCLNAFTSIEIEDYVLQFYSSLQIQIYKDSKFYKLTDAYEKGIVSIDIVKDLAARYPLF